MQQKKTIAIFTAPEGHLSIAEAIEETLTPKFSIKTHLSKSELFTAYVPMYQLFPSAFKIPFNLAKNNRALKPLARFFHFKYENVVEKFHISANPDIYISTYFMYNPSIEKISVITHTPFINILTDPRSFHPILISPRASQNITFDKTAHDTCQSLNTECHSIQMGWFVRSRFEESYNKEVVRRKLKLHPSSLTFLIASGSEGTSLVLKILPIFFQAKKKIQIIVACGNNKTLFSSVNTFSKVMKKMNKNVHVVPLKFTKNIHEYMQAADLVIGKAGPNTLFESVATLTPFFAITHIAGQEDGNLDIIKEYNLGYVEENPIKASRIIKRIIQNPQELDQFQHTLIKMAENNKNAKMKLIHLVEKLLVDK